MTHQFKSKFILLFILLFNLQVVEIWNYNHLIHRITFTIYQSMHLV